MRDFLASSKRHRSEVGRRGWKPPVHVRFKDADVLRSGNLVNYYLLAAWLPLVALISLAYILMLQPVQ